MYYKFRKRYIFLIGIIFALFLLGSFYDYAISNALYIGQHPSENIFGIIFSYIGVIPTFIGWSFLGTVIWYCCKNEVVKKKKIFLKSIAILQYILSFFFFNNAIMFTNDNVFNIHWLIAYTIGMITIALSIYGGYLFVKKSNNKNLLKDAIFISIISIITMVLTMTIKEAMSRPRYTFILEMNDHNFFINWWENGHAIKNSIGENVISEYFKSFPSGHSSYSMFAIFIFPLLGNYNNVSKGKEMIFFILGIIWWILTAYSRITVGAHYLTDVSFGGMITLIGYLITLLIFKNKNKKFE